MRRVVHKGEEVIHLSNLRIETVPAAYDMPTARGTISDRARVNRSARCVHYVEEWPTDDEPGMADALRDSGA